MRLPATLTATVLALAACTDSPTTANVQPQLDVQGATAPIELHEVDVSAFPDIAPYPGARISDAGENGTLLLTYYVAGDTARQVLIAPDGTAETVLAPDGTPRVFTARINDRGDVAGNYGARHAASGFLRAGAGTTTFSVPGGDIRYVAGVNADGLMGVSYLGTGWAALAVSADGTQTTIPLIGTPPTNGSAGQFVGDVNDRGDIVGRQWTYEYIPGVGSVREERAWIWSSDLGIRDLGDWNAPQGVIVGGVNESGQVAGTRRMSWSCPEAVVASEAAPLRVLPNPFGTCASSAEDINDAGMVVGAVRDADGLGHGIVWLADGTHEILPVPPGATFTIVTSVTNTGVIGGAFYADGQYHPAYWTLALDPQTKADCTNGGWEDYGFKNQGQCIRMVETGKDSR